MADLLRGCPCSSLGGRAQSLATRVAGRLVRLLLLALLFVPVQSPSGWRGVRAGETTTIRNTSPHTSARPREVKLPALSRSGIKRQTGSGSLPVFALPPRSRIRLALAPRSVRPLATPAGAVLPRRLNRPLYSGASPPLPG
jgi:hypothetical protein